MPRSLDVAAAMLRAKVDVPDTYPYDHDDKTFARLLVFANELETDAETIRKDAAKLRQALLGIHLHQVQNSGRPGGDDA